MSTIFYKLFLASNILSFCSVQASNFSNGTLLYSHVIFRHGDRTPVATFPTDLYQSQSDWNEQWGEVTIIGKIQQYDLGLWLRERYGTKLLSIKYIPSEIYVRSSDVDRTLDCAETVLAAFYPPKEDQIWNKNLLWQPVPVHTVPLSEDYLLGANLPSCPAFLAYVRRYEESQSFIDFNAALTPLYDYLTKYAGTVIRNIGDITYIRDTLLIEDIHKKELQTWARAIYPENCELYKGALKSFTAVTDTPEMAKYRSGFLLKNILDGISNKIAGSNYTNMMFYSTHDVVLASLLNTLKIFDKKFVGYGACLMFDVRLYNDKPFIEIFYKNPDLTWMFIPGCGYSCPLDEFYKLYENILPKKGFGAECDLKNVI